MVSELKGYTQLQARLHAMQKVTPQFMNKVGLQVVREAKLEVHRKTGHTGRTIHVASATEKQVTVTAGGAGVFLEFGTRAHEITPKAAMALRWAASPAGRRLSGNPRIGAAVIFAKRVHHPGTRPYPFLFPAAKKVSAKLSTEPIVEAWNSGA